MSPMGLAPFDPMQDFKVIGHTLLCAGKEYSPGQAFDKETVDVELLRKLYEGRQISQHPAKAPGHVNFKEPENVKPEIKLGMVRQKRVRPISKRA